MNVHRWRKLEGSDPAVYELIQKASCLVRARVPHTELCSRVSEVRMLQKRLIGKTEEVVAKDLEISVSEARADSQHVPSALKCPWMEEKERLHTELTTLLEKQPGPEVMEQLEAALTHLMR
eukprot:3378336-Amphidinium_carterae.1